MYVWIGDIVCCFYPRIELALWDHAQEWWDHVDPENIFIDDLAKYAKGDPEWAYAVNRSNLEEFCQVPFNTIRDTVSIQELLSFYVRSRGCDTYGPVIKRVFASGEVVTDANLSSSELKAIKDNNLDSSYRNVNHKTKPELNNY